MCIRMREENVTMNIIMSNYKKDNEIQEELKNVNMENHLMFNYQSEYVFKTCEYCTGPLLGHLPTKCPKLEYNENGIKRFLDYLQNIGGFDEALKRREKSYWENRAKWSNSKAGTVTSGTAGGTTQIVKPRPPPLWKG